jgi:hypothetical protein
LWKVPGHSLNVLSRLYVCVSAIISKIKGLILYYTMLMTNNS